MSTLHADIFIVPNSIIRVRESDLERLVIQNRQELLDEEFRPRIGDEMVQIWITDSENDNWSDGSNPVNGMFFVNRLPMRLFEGHSEGETTYLPLADGRTVQLTLNQSDYRYRNHGSFEEVLQRLPVTTLL